MAITGIDHVNIDTTKPEETIAFYETVLGLQNRPDKRPDFGFPGAWLFHGNQAVVHLNFHDPDSDSAAKLSQAERTGAFNHIAFAAADFDGTCQQLDEMGLDYRTSERPSIKLKQIFVRDPNNVAVELNINE